jgi:YkoY family integral membrane protein
VILAAFFNQTFAPPDLLTVGILVVLEGVLSIDNAVVLGILASRLEPTLRMKALSYGLIGALVLRIVMVGLAAYLMRWKFLQILGGAYLILLAIKHFATPKKHSTNPDESAAAVKPFWFVVAEIEFLDIVFAIDSILAAVALIGPAPPGSPAGSIHPKLWVVVTGGMLGVAVMRFAASIFGNLVIRFPRLNASGYLLVLLIGIRMVADQIWDLPDSLEFWTFWAIMLGCLALGFVPKSDAIAKPVDTIKS